MIFLKVSSHLTGTIAEKNVAVGIVVGSIFVGLGIAVGLVIGMALN